jgi:CelD/BcsL family acetyltransferase involved in cellulose biosynthesis
LADRIRFTKMPLEVRGRPNPLALLRESRTSETAGFIVDLPERFEDYQRSLKKDVQSLLRRRWDKLVKDTKAELRWIDNVDEGRRVLAVLQRQQKERLDGLGARHVFDQPAHLQFYERHVVEGLASGGAVLTAIVAGEEVIATFLGVTDGRCCTLIRSSQLGSENWMRYGLGKLIIDRSMRALHERGYRQFDLSIGDLAYKHDFGVKPVAMADLDVACSWRALPSVCRDYTWQRLRKNPVAASLARSARRILSFRDAPVLRAS